MSFVADIEKTLPMAEDSLELFSWHFSQISMNKSKGLNLGRKMRETSLRSLDQLRGFHYL